MESIWLQDRAEENKIVTPSYPVSKDQPHATFIGVGSQELPAMIDPGPEGFVISRWHAGFRERLRFLLHGDIYQWTRCGRTAGGLNPLQPSYLHVNALQFAPLATVSLVDPVKA